LSSQFQVAKAKTATAISKNLDIAFLPLLNWVPRAVRHRSTSERRYALGRTHKCKISRKFLFLQNNNWCVSVTGRGDSGRKIWFYRRLMQPWMSVLTISEDIGTGPKALQVFLLNYAFASQSISFRS
jgi:hypothetical protein